MQKLLLIIAHAPSENTLVLRDALIQGARQQSEDNFSVRCVSPFQVTADQVLAASGVILATPENFGYMAGATKDFFDRCYYDLLDKTNAMPYALAIRAGLDGTGTKRALCKICDSMKWKLVQDPLVMKGKYQTQFRTDCVLLGATMAAGLQAGIY